MATPHEIALAATLLRNAADFYRTVGSEKPELREDFEAQAETCELIADLVESDPDRPLLYERGHGDTAPGGRGGTAFHRRCDLVSSPWPYRLHLLPPQREGRVSQIRRFARHFTMGPSELEETPAGTVCLLFREEADFKLVAAWLKLGCRPDEGEVLGTNLTTGELRKI